MIALSVSAAASRSYNSASFVFGMPGGEPTMGLDNRDYYRNTDRGDTWGLDALTPVVKNRGRDR